ncbi:MAG: hypothetical protein GF317_00710 [Candidatus Lokiarchaeota archaeon]|nr:hypothetical protein [Candidatus Lokiarchaeota archaeon]
MSLKNIHIKRCDRDNIFKVVKPTFIDIWYPQLQKETIETKFIPITENECKTLIYYGEFRFLIKDKNFSDIKFIKKITNILSKKIQPILEYFNNKAFFRLVGRSAKDSHGFYLKAGLVENIEDIFKQFIDSERLIEDIFLCLKFDYPQKIVLRKWVEIKKHEEFRLIIINKEIKGISQYYYFQNKYFPELVNNIKYYQESIFSYFDKIKDLFELEDYVLDIIYYKDSPKVLEINPLCDWTDPCLFDWKKDDFADFEFRYIKNKKY